MEIGIYVQVTTCTDISVAERAGGLSERLEMVSSSEQVSVGTLPGRHSVALQIDTQRTGLKQLLLVSHRQIACSYTDKQLQQQQQWREGGRTFHTVHWL